MAMRWGNNMKRIDQNAGTNVRIKAILKRYLHSMLDYNRNNNRKIYDHGNVSDNSPVHEIHPVWLVYRRLSDSQDSKFWRKNSLDSRQRMTLKLFDPKKLINPQQLGDGMHFKHQKNLLKITATKHHQTKFILRQWIVTISDRKKISFWFFVCLFQWNYKPSSRLNTPHKTVYALKMS